MAPLLAAILIQVVTGCGSGEASPTAANPSASTSAGHSDAGGAFCSAAGRFNADQAAIKQQGGAATILRAARDAVITSAQMRQFAPASLAADVRVVTERFEPFFAALVADRGVMSKAIGVELRISGTLRGSQFRSAAAALGGYEARHCGMPPVHGH